MQQHFPAADLHRLNFTTSQAELSARQWHREKLGCEGGQGRMGGGRTIWESPARARSGVSGAGDLRGTAGPSSCLRTAGPAASSGNALRRLFLMLCEKASPPAS